MRLVQRYSGRFSLFGKGRAFHHSFQTSQRCGDSFGEFLRFGCASLARETGSNSLATAAALRLRSSQAFFRLLPRTTSAAAVLARNHDDRLDGHESRPNTPAAACFGGAAHFVHGRKVRRPTAKARHCTCCGRHCGKWPFIEDATTDFVYVRLHGDEKLYSAGIATLRCNAGSERSAHGPTATRR
jgi:hypothetical protein